MVWTLNFWVGSAFCVLLGCAAPAQTIGADAPKYELQAEGDQFVEATKALNAATDKDSRRKAIDLVLARAEEIKLDPVPLVAVLKNRQPEALYTELLAYLKESDKVRHVSFLPSLISAANDGGEKSATPRGIVLAYNAEVVIAAMQAMLKGDDAVAAIAAAAFAREKVGKIKGRARLVPPLVAALSSSSSDLRATAGRALRELTLLDYPDEAARWTEWLGQKSEETLIEEIANRQGEALRKSEAQRKELEDKLVKVTLAQMAGQKDNLGALLVYLSESEFLQVRIGAARFMAAALPKAVDDAKAQPAVDALGGILLAPANDEALRIECVLALSARPSIGFAYIDKALELNGLGPSLKLACVHALKDGRAALRLAALLQLEIDGINGTGGTLLGELLAQAQSVFDPSTTAEARAAVLEQIARLLRLVEAKFGAELPIGERDRYASLAQQAAGTLVGIARVRATDISDCVEPLIDVAIAMGNKTPAASTSCLTAVREALGIAPKTLPERLGAEPLAGKLHGLYDRLFKENGAQSLFIALLAIYAEMGQAPQDILDAVLKELLSNAEAAADPLSPDGATTTRRGAIRRLLTRTTRGIEAQAVMINAFLDKPYGDNDALDFIRNLPPPRGPLIVQALGTRGSREPLRVGLLVKGFDDGLSAETRDSPEYKGFKENLFKAVRAEFVRRLTAALQAPMDDSAKEALKQQVQSKLWEYFMSAAYECLLAAPAKSAERDFLAALLLEKLKAAHPGHYDTTALGGEAAEFTKSLTDLKPKLTEDGYVLG